MYRKGFVSLTLIVTLLLLPSCVPKAIIAYSTHEESGIEYLFTRKQQILFLGFFGKERQRYESKQHIEVLSLWLAKRPLYKDFAGMEINREVLPTVENLKVLSKKYETKRILLFRTIPTLSAMLFTFGKMEKHEKWFQLTSVPTLSEADDLHLTLASLDALIQPAAQILSVEADGSLIVLPRTTPIETLKTFLILPHPYFEQKNFIAKARVIGSLSPTVLKIQDNKKDKVLHKGLWAFPIITSTVREKICSKHRATLEKSKLTYLPGVFTKGKASFRRGTIWEP